MTIDAGRRGRPDPVTAARCPDCGGPLADVRDGQGFCPACHAYTETGVRA